MGKHQQAYTNHMKVECLCTGFKCHEDKIIDLALFYVKDNKINDYQGAVSYLGDKVLVAFPPKIGDGTKKHIGGAISPLKVGKAAKVKGKGGAKAGKTFNSVDCSNFTHDFLMDEWNKMGEDRRNFIKTSQAVCHHDAKDEQ